MWTQVGAENAAGLERHVAIMKQMDHGYGKLVPRDLVRVIIENRGELWHYRGQGFEIGMLFQFSWEHGQWQLAQVGFVGNAAPAAVLDLNVDRGRSFFQSHSIDSVFCGVPHQMDHPPLLAYYQLCRQHPQLQIAVIHQSEAKDIWEIRYVAT